MLHEIPARGELSRCAFATLEERTLLLMQVELDSAHPARRCRNGCLFAHLHRRSFLTYFPNPAQYFVPVPLPRFKATNSATKREDLMKKHTKTALVLCMAVLGTAIEARANCQHVRGGITETVIPSPNDPLGRSMGNVNGVLNGATTAILTSIAPPSPSGVLTATSFDVFVTNPGDVLTATGAPTLTPVPGQPPGEFTEHTILTITGGSGKYDGATGTITLEGQAHNVFGGPGEAIFDLTYEGSICGPDLKADAASSVDKVQSTVARGPDPSHALLARRVRTVTR
jgi:hypothetical protein